MATDYGITGPPFPPERDVENILERHYDQGGNFSAHDPRRTNVSWHEKTISNRRRVLEAWRRRGFSIDEADDIARANIQIASPLGKKMISRRKAFQASLRKQGYDSSQIYEFVESNSFARWNIETYILDLYEGQPEVVESQYKGSINENRRIRRTRSRINHRRAQEG